jgi:hypothetical protein
VLSLHIAGAFVLCCVQSWCVSLACIYTVCVHIARVYIYI